MSDPYPTLQQMEVCIHDAAGRVGGSCVEFDHQGARIVVDLGLPLEAAADRPPPLPPVRGLRGDGPPPLAVVVTHGHPDHHGQLPQLPPGIPVITGAATARLLREAAFFTRAGVDVTPSAVLEDHVPLEIGPFTVTPLLVDHSAFDTHALIIEAGGRRLLYSADLRAHGRKAALFERLVRSPPPGIHVLMLEGTQVTPAGAGSRRPAFSETDVEDGLVDICRQTPGMVLAAFSGQNIDRLVSAFRAARRTGRELVMDLYGAGIAAATGNPRVPQAGWDGVRVLVPARQRGRVIAAGAFERIEAVRSARIHAEELRDRRGELLVTHRGSMEADLTRAGCLADAHAVWSMWAGYLDRPTGAVRRAWFERHGIAVTHLHASGHATVEDLQRLARAVDAERVAPIHTWAPERYGELFERVEVREAGAWWAV